MAPSISGLRQAFRLNAISLKALTPHASLGARRNHLHPATLALLDFPSSSHGSLPCPPLHRRARGERALSTQGEYPEGGPSRQLEGGPRRQLEGGPRKQLEDGPRMQLATDCPIEGLPTAWGALPVGRPVKSKLARRIDHRQEARGTGFGGLWGMVATADSWEVIGGFA